MAEKRDKLVDFEAVWHSYNICHIILEDERNQMIIMIWFT